MKENRQGATMLTLNIYPGSDINADDLDWLTHQLRSELNEIAVESVGFIQEGQVPSGAKSAEAITAGALAIAVLPPFIPQLVSFPPILGDARREPAGNDKISNWRPFH